MRKTSTPVWTLLVLLALLVGACGASGNAQVPRAVPTDAPVAARNATTAPTAVPVEPTEVQSEPTAAPTEVAAPVGEAPTKRRAPDPKPTKTPDTKPTPTATPKPVQAAEPMRLKIPKLGIDAAVEHVGQVLEGPTKGAMDVPKKWENVAWYQKERWGGTVPGEAGNAVLAGHLDTNDKANPCAVFCRLEEIEPGDEVQVLDEKGKVTRFRVRKKQVYFDEDAPLYDIFGPSGEAHLNLITCEGEFDRDTERYDRKLVVFTDKIA